MAASALRPLSLGEVLMKPTAMLFRNLMAMDVEECMKLGTRRSARSGPGPRAV